MDICAGASGCSRRTWPRRRSLHFATWGPSGATPKRCCRERLDTLQGQRMPRAARTCRLWKASSSLVADPRPYVPQRAKCAGRQPDAPLDVLLIANEAAELLAAPPTFVVRAGELVHPDPLRLVLVRMEAVLGEDACHHGQGGLEPCSGCTVKIAVVRVLALRKEAVVGVRAWRKFSTHGTEAGLQIHHEQEGAEAIPLRGSDVDVERVREHPVRPNSR